MIIFTLVYILTMGVFLYGSLIYNNFNILGVILSPSHAKDYDVKELIKKAKVRLLILSILGLGLVGLSQVFKGSRFYDVFFIGILLIYPLGGSLILARAYRDLLSLKDSRGWTYEGRFRSVSLESSREKGRWALSIGWLVLAWMFSLVPLAYEILFRPAGSLDLIYVLVMPLSMGLMVLAYPMVVRTPSMAISDNENENLAYYRTLERINSITYILSMVFTIIFMNIIYFIGLGYFSDNLYMLIIFLFFISYALLYLWGTRSKSKAMKNYVKDDSWSIQASQGHYSKWGFYSNPEDSRTLVPKRNPGLGLTLNMAKTSSKITMALTLVFTLGVLGFAFMMGIRDFSYDLGQDSLSIEAMMYGQEIEYENIEDISYKNQDLDMVRTNGYGGSNKGYGYFTVKGLGPVLLYYYALEDNPAYIILKLKNEKRPYIILNEKTNEATRDLYEDLVEKIELGV